jgi:hypothetical protein
MFVIAKLVFILFISFSTKLINTIIILDSSYNYELNTRKINKHFINTNTTRESQLSIQNLVQQAIDSNHDTPHIPPIIIKVNDSDDKNFIGLTKSETVGSIVGFLTFCLGTLQYLIIRRQTKIMGTQAAIMDDQKMFMHTSLLNSQSNTSTQLRPYIFFDSFSFNWVGTNNIIGYKLEIVWKNCGMTPAKNVYAYLNVDIFKSIISSDYKFQDCYDDSSKCTPIGPGQLKNFDQYIDIAKLIDTSKNNSLLYFWGWIEYDGLDIRHRHRTEVCAKISITGDPSELIHTPNPHYTALFHIYFTPCFNGYDQDCQHKPHR